MVRLFSIRADSAGLRMVSRGHLYDDAPDIPAARPPRPRPPKGVGGLTPTERKILAVATTEPRRGHWYAAQLGVCHVGGPLVKLVACGRLVKARGGYRLP